MCVILLNDQNILCIMNDKAILSSVDRVDSKKKPDFKELCKKFENLSGNEIKEEEIPRTPQVPARRTKCQSDISIKRREPVLKNSPKYRNSTTENTPKRPISVKERSKLFEATVEGTSDNRSQSPQFVRQISKNNDSDNFVPSAIPPAKPPRVFANLENNKPKISKSISPDANKRSSVNINSSAKSPSKNSKPRNASFSFESETIPEIVPPRLMSAPIVIASEDSAKIKNKTGIRSYLKSQASNLRDKVKQTKVFVDLTPTTVSPPKHYGTLKRSKSEEHIYAEPCINGISPKKKEDTKPDESLHYMVELLS